MREILLRLNTADQIGDLARRGFRVLKSFAGNFKTKISQADGIELELGIQPELGSADSGDLEHDLSELLIAVAEAAKETSSSVCLIIDELQYLNEAEMSPLVMALR